ncbi:MAG: hypothetical protein JSS34_08765 [Proteobacteria bacterium]|nr:hypothetical protein [Pseudomonadota bacterium]
MKAVIDRNEKSNSRITGLKLEIRGRVNGSLRSQKKVAVYGRQQQQHTGSVIEMTKKSIETKYGTLGLRVQRATEPKDQMKYRGLKMSTIN